MSDQEGCSDELDPKMVAAYKALLKTHLGIQVEPAKEYLLASRLQRICRQGGDLPILLGILKQNHDLADRMLGRYFTTGHTFFFRESEHFDFLAKDLRERGLRKPTLWCAASSSGEEPYTIAITLLEAGVSDFTLLASDINVDALRACAAGVYRTERLHAMSPRLVERYFTKGMAGHEEVYKIRPELRAKLILKRINLTDPLRFQAKFDYVFCRNVFIYFPKDTQERVLKTIAANMAADGRLFMGFSEPLLNSRDLFDQLAPSVYTVHK
jgi:chemotaxis protein methyltransferase CheR